MRPAQAGDPAEAVTWVGGERSARRREALVRAAVRILALAVAACGAADPRAGATGASEVAFVALGGETFTLELALDAERRQQGLSGRHEIPRNAGMLFVLPRPQPLAMVMRDCAVPIDLALIDAEGRVVALHEMSVEPPRAPGEPPFAYEARLPRYGSPVPVQFAIETGGGRLRELGLAVGERVVFDREGLVARAR
jgi:hypothetical protein